MLEWLLEDDLPIGGPLSQLPRKITLDVVKRLQPGQIAWDSAVAGFAVRRQRSEVRTYVVKIRIRNRQRWLTIGRHGSPWTPETARREALRLLGEVSGGADPANERDERQADITVAELCDIYVQEAKAGNILTKFGVPKKATTLATDCGRIERHIKPLIGRRYLRDITSREIRRFMQAVASGKTAVDEKTGPHGRALVTGGRGTATRTVGLLGGIFSFAVDRGLRDDNPVRNVKRYPDRKQERFLTEAEFAKLGTALAEAETRGESPFGLAAIRLLMLTGCRKSEILQLHWSNVDLENACLRLTDSKTGERTVFLGVAAADLLRGLPRLSGNPFVIPGRLSGQHLVGLPKIWERVKRRAGLDWATLHVLRHSFASYGAGSGLGLPIIGKLLGHKDAATTARYAKIDYHPARAAVEQISAGIAGAIDQRS